MTAGSAERLLHSPAQGAERLGISKSGFYALMAAGEIKSVKIGRLRRIPEAELLAYIRRLSAMAS